MQVPIMSRRQILLALLLTLFLNTLPCLAAPNRSYYEVLGVHPNASKSQIDRAARHLLLELHPDPNSGDRSGEQKFTEVMEAWKALRNKDQKSVYDQKLEREKNGTSYPFRGGKVSPNRENRMATLDDLKNFSFPSVESEPALSFAKNELLTVPRGSVTEMSLWIYEHLKAGILKQMPTVREELTILNVTQTWIGWIINETDFSISKCKAYGGMEDFPLYEASFRGMMLWLTDIRYLSENLYQFEMKQLGEKLASVRTRLEAMESNRPDERQDFATLTPDKQERLMSSWKAAGRMKPYVESIQRFKQALETPAPGSTPLLLLIDFSCEVGLAFP